jgi:hypothetical protein
MAERTFNDSGLDGIGLASVPAPSDREDQESGIAQPGQLHPGPVDTQALRIRKESQTDGANVITQASDSFAIVSAVVDQKKAYQLLPADPNRKRAIIQCLAVNGFYIGDQASIDAVASAAIAAGVAAPGCFFIPGIALNANPGYGPIEYTSKAPLFCCSTSLGAVPIQALVERFNSGTRVS